MIIYVSYWDIFWIGLVVGWVLCWYLPRLLNIQVQSKGINSIEPNYLKPSEINYKPVDYVSNMFPERGYASKLPKRESPNVPESKMPPLKKPKK